jgi:hypothetical protein
MMLRKRQDSTLNTLDNTVEDEPAAILFGSLAHRSTCTRLDFGGRDLRPAEVSITGRMTNGPTAIKKLEIDFGGGDGDGDVASHSTPRCLPVQDSERSYVVPGHIPFGY